MIIEKVNIINYKCFQGRFSLTLTDGINILVGNNEAGKSTILEAINLAVSGMINGRYLSNELNQYLFNKYVVADYLASLTTKNKVDPPSIIIEIFLPEDKYPRLLGDNNSERLSASGFSLKISLDNACKDDYADLIASDKQLSALPMEYYSFSWQSFSFDSLTIRAIPIGSMLIDSSSARLQNSSDVYISRIIQNNLPNEDKIRLSQAYREMQQDFKDNEAVKEINKSIENSKVSTKPVEISVELPTKNAWESALMTFVDNTPFQQIGKGEQCVIKTNLALEQKRGKKDAIVLLEEPENHLTHTKLNEFIGGIHDKYKSQQMLLTTHSSFVANKLELSNLILLNEGKTTRLNSLTSETYNFFQRIAGYPTLRLILCKKAVLVEGDSDELIFQKAYQTQYGKLPIQDGIDVISVRLAFKRFLEIAAKIGNKVAVITDNDADYEHNITDKYKDYADLTNITIFADKNNDYRTLEPQFVHTNRDIIPNLCNIFKIEPDKYPDEESLSHWMKYNKTKWAFSIFDSKEVVKYPDYILRAVKWCHE
jgi:putative ATP-dependent endonuclease of OLD family